MVRMIHGDCLEVMASMPEASVDAIVTDRPGEPVRIFGIDPGPEESDYVLLDSAGSKILAKGSIGNGALMLSLFSRGTTTEQADVLVIEDFAPYGNRLGHESLRTIKAIGAFEAAWTCAERGPCWSVPRKDAAIHLCGVRTAGDRDIRDALIERFGPGRKRAVGTKREPGPLYGVKAHQWAALAVAVTIADQQVEGGQE